MVLWFSDQKSKPLEIEDKIIITLVINEHVTYKKLTRQSVETNGGIFLKGYGFFTFDKYLTENIGKDISKNLSSIYSQKLLDHTKQSIKDTCKST